MSEFEEGYKAGWNAANEYARDCNYLNMSGTRFGLLMITFFGLGLVGSNIVAYKQGVLSEMMGLDLLMLCLIMVGFFVDNLEQKSYKRKKDAHNEKWKSIDG